jgi:hypothetical protein
LVFPFLLLKNLISPTVNVLVSAMVHVQVSALYVNIFMNENE